MELFRIFLFGVIHHIQYWSYSQNSWLELFTIFLIGVKIPDVTSVMCEILVWLSSLKSGVPPRTCGGKGCIKKGLHAHPMTLIYDPLLTVWLTYVRVRTLVPFSLPLPPLGLRNNLIWIRLTFWFHRWHLNALMKEDADLRWIDSRLRLKQQSPNSTHRSSSQLQTLWKSKALAVCYLSKSFVRCSVKDVWNAWKGGALSNLGLSLWGYCIFM